MSTNPRLRTAHIPITARAAREGARMCLPYVPGFFIMAVAAPTARRAAWIGLAWGWGFHIAGLHWLTNAILTEADRYWWLVPIAVPALALPLGAFTILPALAVRLAAPGWPRILAFAASLPQLQAGYRDCWTGLRKTFDPSKP